MYDNFAKPPGSSRKQRCSSLVVLLLLCSALRAQQVCPVEIKLLISPQTTDSVITSLGFQKEARSQVYFFDTDNLSLLQQGVILRVRQGARNDLTVKVRLPDGDKRINSSKLREHFGCQIDRTGAEANTSFAVGRKYKPNAVAVTGKELFKALSPHQQKLLKEAQASINWSSVRRIADINSTTWESTSQSQFPRLTLEYWEWSAGSTLELSIKVAPDQSDSKLADLLKIVNEKGLSLSAEQRTKTSMVLKSLMTHPNAQSQTASHGTNPLSATRSANASFLGTPREPPS
jgi:hypothetical protein